MLKELYIRNYAIIETLSVSFDSGFQVMTGETGAGKSIIVDCLGLLMGDRINRQAIRQGEDSALVEAVFELSEEQREAFREMGYDVEDEVLISRAFTEKSSQARIDGRPVPLTLLRPLMARVLQVHGQNNQQILGEKRNYLSLLDAYEGDETDGHRKRLGELLAKRKELEDFLDAFDIQPEELEREKDILEYQVQEIEDFDFEHYDEEALNEEYKILIHAKKIKEELKEDLDLLTGSGYGKGVLDLFKGLTRSLVEMSEYNQKFSPMKDKAYDLYAESEALSEDIKDAWYQVEPNPQRVEELESIFERHFLLQNKYGQTKEAILKFLEEAKERLSVLNDIDHKREEANAKLQKVDLELHRVAEELTKKRREKADRLEKVLLAELKDLNLKKIQFRIDIKDRELTANGKDDVDFMISTNEGQDLHSLSEVASGGEMSRFMLAFQTVLADVEKISTLVFDEIDTGISGRTAQVVAEKISDISKGRQTIVITHLPQIAAMAKNHYLLEKESSGGTTKSSIRPLNQEERVEELMRLIGGAQLTETTRSSAEEMLKQGQSIQRGERNGTN